VVRVRAASLAFALSVCAACQPQPARQSATPSTTPSPSVAAFPTFVDVGGHSLWIDCVGEGSPTVVLDSGLPGTSEDWAALVPLLDDLTRVCVYDRAGEGISDPRPRESGPASSAVMAEELHRLLRGSGVPAPYVLVGWSFGGVVARTFEGRYPDEVAGIVLEDVLTEWAIASAGFRRSIEDSRTPEDPIDWDGTISALRRAGGIDAPVVVVTAGVPREGTSAAEHERHLRLQRRLTRSSGDAIHVVAEDAEHAIHFTDHEVIVLAIELAVRANREGAELPRCDEAFRGLPVTCLS
jgi:hypothetical protein